MDVSERHRIAAERAQQSLYDLVESEQLSRQAAMFGWAKNAFGEASSTPKERARRVLEEALELAQAEGVHAAEAQKLLEYTYGRPQGEPAQELGGVMLTTLLYAEARELSRHAVETAEVNRVLQIPIEAMRARHKLKAQAGVAIDP